MSSLALLQLVSPALPVGAFSYSEGLEALIQAGALKDESGLEQWLRAELERGALRLEAAALTELIVDLNAWATRSDEKARGRVLHLDGWLLASREAAEMRAQQRQMGALFCSCWPIWVIPCRIHFPWPGRLPGLGRHCHCRCRSWRWLRGISTAGLPISSVRRCDCCPWAPRGRR